MHPKMHNLLAATRLVMVSSMGNHNFRHAIEDIFLSIVKWIESQEQQQRDSRLYVHMLARMTGNDCCTYRVSVSEVNYAEI